MRFQNFLLSIPLVIAYINLSYAQSSVPILADSLKVEGVYFSFEEFRQNNPSLKCDLERVTYGPAGIGLEAKSKAHIEDQYRLKLADSAKVKMRKVWGFCDGKKIYRVQKFRQGPFGSYVFNEIQWLGRYCYYQNIEGSYYPMHSSSPVGYGHVSGGLHVSATKVEMIVNMNNGKDYDLCEGNVRLILKKDKELLDEFNKDIRSPIKLLFYVKKFCERNPGDLKSL